MWALSDASFSPALPQEGSTILEPPAAHIHTMTMCICVHVTKLHKWWLGAWGFNLNRTTKRNHLSDSINLHTHSNIHRERHTHTQFGCSLRAANIEHTLITHNALAYSSSWCPYFCTSALWNQMMCVCACVCVHVCYVSTLCVLNKTMLAAAERVCFIILMMWTVLQMRALLPYAITYTIAHIYTHTQTSILLFCTK